MIYQPQPYFNVQLAVGAAFLSAFARAATDYIIGEGKPWAYYLGYGFGGAALATGIQGAQATLYVIGGGTVKIFLEKAPGAAIAGIFLDGIADANLNLDDEIVDVVEHVLNIPNDGLQHSITLYNFGTDPDSLNNPDNWLSILGIEPAAGVNLEERISTVADLFLISLTVRDAKTLSTGRKRNTMPVSFFFNIGALTIANIIAKHDAVVAAVDGISGAVVISSSITLYPTLPAGLKGAAEAASDVQEGALLSFDLTASNYVDSVFIPAIKQALVGADGQSILITDALFVTLEDAITVEGGAAVPAANRFGVTYADLATGEKTFRK